MITLEVQSPSTSNLLTLASSVPIGQRGIVHTEGRNDMPTSQILGFHWVVKDPDGLVVEDYEDWTLFGVAPRDTEERMTPRFDLNKEGTYTLKVDLLMNPDSPVVVDSYDGDLCTVTTELPPEYELIQHTIYPYSYVYDGDVEVSIFTFTSAPFVPIDWVVEKFADAVANEVEKKGGQILELKAYADTTPLLLTNFRIEVIGTPLGGAVEAAPGIAVGIPIWAAILIAALAIALLIIVITWSIKTITETFTHKPISEEIKKAMARETLISLIGDLEVKYEATPKPPEELEEMSDAELREYCDSLPPPAPPISPWAVLALAGGLGIVGVGAAFALSQYKPRG